MRVLAIASAIVVGIVASVNAEPLRIGTSADFPPWESTDALGNIVGFDRDVGDEICRRINAECAWSNQAFDGLLPSLQVGKFDIVISGISITAERAEQVDFSSAYADSAYHFVTNKGNALAAIKTREDLEKGLEGKAIGVQTGSTHESVVRKYFKDADIRLYDRNEQVADDLTAGRLDAGLLELSAWEELMKTRIGELEFAGPMLTSADYREFGDGTGIALKKGRNDLKARVDKAIEGMLSDGTVGVISTKYFGYDISFKR